MVFLVLIFNTSVKLDYEPGELSISFGTIEKKIKGILGSVVILEDAILPMKMVETSVFVVFNGYEKSVLIEMDMV